MNHPLHNGAYALFYTTPWQWLRIGQLAAALMIFAYYALKPPGTPGNGPLSDEVLHFSGNVLLALSCWVAFFGRWNLRYLVVAAFIYSMAIEIAQGLTPARTPDMADALMNTAGLCAGTAIAFLLQGWLRHVKRLKEQEQTR